MLPGPRWTGGTRSNLIPPDRRAPLACPYGPVWGGSAVLCHSLRCQWDEVSPCMGQSRRWEPGGVRDLPTITGGGQCPVLLPLHHCLACAPGICLASRGDNEPVLKPYKRHPYPDLPWEAATELGPIAKRRFSGSTDRSGSRGHLEQGLCGWQGFRGYFSGPSPLGP